MQFASWSHRTKLFLILGLYLLTRMAFLTRLPVFADEAIYIRWAQIAANEPQKHLFLSMLDGKPPLHNWLIIPFTRTLPDPLFAGRLLSVLVGFLALWAVSRMVKLLGGSAKDQRVGLLIVTLMPFWLVHHRLALAESLLISLFLTSLYFGLSLFKSPDLKTTLGLGLSFGLALWTKTNAIFFIPVLALTPLLAGSTQLVKSKSKGWIKSLFHLYTRKATILLVLGGIMGGLVFISLKLTPLFSFLFTRSADYTFSFTEIIAGEWQHVVNSSIPKVAGWLAWYTSPLLLLPLFFGGRKNLWLAIMALIYCAPLVVFGRIISPRYFFPAAGPATLMIVFGLQYLRAHRPIINWIVWTGFILTSLIFAGLFIIAPAKTPFVAVDRQQYLTDWSSGHGIPEARDFIKDRIKSTKVTVITEGYFGTLPDGLLMYFDHSPDIRNLSLYGIGQPIRNIPKDVLEAANQEEVYLVVNSHRFLMNQSSYMQKVGEYPRPYNGPSLLLFKINPPEISQPAS